MKTLLQYIKNNAVKLVAASMMATAMSACDMDFRNTQAIDPEAAWGDQKMIEAYLTHIYSMMPGWNFVGEADEAIDADTNMSDFYKGNNLSVSNCGQNFNYDYIDRINFLLDELADVPTSVLTTEANNQIKAQALFWRAWVYWNSVREVGGVPLILHKQNADDLESLFVKRNTTSECMAQIIADLDEAINNLPDKWTGSDYGRIDRCAAMAFKGRVLLWYASPLFNRNNDQARWQAAYDANKAALDACLAAGHALLPDFSQIWLTDGSANTEAIMFRRYKYPDSYYGMEQLLPEPLTNGWACRQVPQLTSLLSFPLKDGSSMAIYPQNAGYNSNALDVERLQNDPAYNRQILETLINGMDPRFYASLSVPGADFPSAYVPAGQNLWTSMVKEEGGYTTMLHYQYGSYLGTAIYGCFYPKKGVTPDTDKSSSTYLGQNPWIEIRLAEVYMNLAECANELNSGSHNWNEALQNIAILRERAGIERGNGAIGFGLDCYNSLEGVRHLLINERLAEFNQEHKRWGDIRRWMLYDMLNEEKYFSNVFVVFNGSADDMSDFDFSSNMHDASTMDHFHLEYVENTKQIEVSHFNLSLNHWFSPIGDNTMAKNYNNDQSQQNNEWGGSFDPLQ